MTGVPGLSNKNYCFILLYKSFSQTVCYGIESCGNLDWDAPKETLQVSDFLFISFSSSLVCALWVGSILVMPAIRLLCSVGVHLYREQSGWWVTSGSSEVKKSPSRCSSVSQPVLLSGYSDCINGLLLWITDLASDVGGCGCGIWCCCAYFSSLNWVQVTPVLPLLLILWQRWQDPFVFGFSD